MRRVSNGLLGCAGGLAIVLAAGTAGAAGKSSAAAVQHPNFDGVWQVERPYSVQARTPSDDGKPVPYLRWTKAINEAALKAEAEGDPWTPNNQRCLVAGINRALKGNFAWQMFQTKDYLSFVFEEDARINQIPFRATHKKHLKPTWYGDPIAHWDGDTAVIDTIGFNEKTPFILAEYHTPAMHTVARLRLINGGKELEMLTTIDDPGAYIHPWENKLVFSRLPANYKLRDYRCIENNRDLPTEGVWGPD